MTQQTIDLIRLCINELLVIRQLMNLKVADDFCSRLLGVYAMMRVDDITKIWSHTIPKNTAERQRTDEIKNKYNQGLRIVRDKLGAHYQSIEGTDAFFASVRVFKSIDYAIIVCLIEDIVEVETIIEGTTIALEGFFPPEDQNTAQEVLKDLFSDNQACLTNGALDVFGMNKVGLMTCSKPQEKGQTLRSIEQMVAASRSLLDRQYVAKEVERLFKRLYVCMVYNYHDNLITRKDINDSAAQYEDGFDILFKSVVSQKDNKEKLETAFDVFESIYQVEPVIKRFRDIRNESCAHFDEHSSVSSINGKLDGLNWRELDKAYEDMLKMFNYICREVFLLRMISLPSRIPIYGSQVVELEGNENFYGESVENGMTGEQTCTEILRSIRKSAPGFDEARERLCRKLMTNDLATYQEMEAAIAERLKESSISDHEKSIIFYSLKQAKSGFPDRLQRSVLYFMQDEGIFNNCSGQLLWLLASICKEDKDIDVPRLLDRIIRQDNAIPTAFSILALLHLEAEKNCSFRTRTMAHSDPVVIKMYCDAVQQPVQKCGLMLMLCQHWFWDYDYLQHSRHEKNYSEYFENELSKALDRYFVFIRMKDKEERALCECYLQTRHYLLLLYRLALKEKERN